MKFKDFVQKANQFLQENPQYAELDMYLSNDEEGNGFNRVNDFYPSVGMTNEKLGYHIYGYDIEDYFKESDEYLDYLSELEYWAEEKEGSPPEEPKFEANILVLYP